MQVAAVAELKARLSQYLARVKAGEEVLVTERGRPIARVVRIDPSDAGEERLAVLVQHGLATRGAGRISKEFWEGPRAEDPEGAVLAALLAEREEGP